jgi:TIR domain
VALAVEQADLVLMCVSQKYKDSPNCRLEGEYCVNKRVKIVPLMMQHGYQADGWLVFYPTFPFFQNRDFAPYENQALALILGEIIHACALWSFASTYFLYQGLGSL